MSKSSFFLCSGESHANVKFYNVYIDECIEKCFRHTYPILLVQ